MVSSSGVCEGFDIKNKRPVGDDPTSHVAPAKNHLATPESTAIPVRCQPREEFYQKNLDKARAFWYYMRMSITPLTVTYGGVKIQYAEQTNKWNFELNGRERNVESLTAAKNMIDKPAPKDKKPFIRIPVYRFSSQFFDKSKSSFIKTEITSIAEASYGGSSHVWIVDPNKSRSKVRIESLFADTEANITKMKAYDLLVGSRDEINTQLASITKRMERAKVSGEED